MHGEARREAIRDCVAHSAPPEPRMDPWWRTARSASYGVAESSDSTVADIVLLNGFEAAARPERARCTAVMTATGDGVVMAESGDADGAFRDA